MTSLKNVHHDRKNRGKSLTIITFLRCFGAISPRVSLVPKLFYASHVCALFLHQRPRHVDTLEDAVTDHALLALFYKNSASPIRFLTIR